MYVEEKKSRNWSNLLKKGLIILVMVLIIFLIVWLFAKNYRKNVKVNYGDSNNTTITEKSNKKKDDNGVNSKAYSESFITIINTYVQLVKIT